MESRSTLNDFLQLRFAELIEASARLKEKLRQTEEEIEQLRAAAKATGIDLEENRNITSEIGRPYRVYKYNSNITMKEAALIILQEFKNGLTAGEITEQMKSRFGMSYPRSSLSPQLSRLKHDGLVQQNGTRWALSKASPSPTEQGSDVFE